MTKELKTLNKVSVIIPTKNPGNIFKKVLPMVLEQETQWKFEVLVLDSGSTDGTVEYVKSLPDVKLHCITPKEFGHGRTRNLGVSLTNGEFIALITHDALPANCQWLSELIKAIEQDEHIAGVFGRHEAYPEDGPYLKRDLNEHFNGFKNGKNIVNKADDPDRYESDLGFRQYLHFFSHNNACIRRAVWEQISYPDVNFAEDQIWAQSIISAGYSKAYADRAVVFHSHHFGAIETCRRSFDESRALNKLFGYCLCPSILYLIEHTLYTTWNDFKYSYEKKIIIKDWKWLVASPFKNLAKQIGFYLGQRADSLPSWVDVFLSRDKRMMMGGYVLKGYWIKLKALNKKLGFIGMCHFLYQYYFGNSINSVSVARAKRDVVAFYNFIQVDSFGESVDNPDSIINWVIPDFGIGSGGHLNIFRMIYLLEQRGLKCRINIDGYCNFSSGRDARECIRKHFFPIDADVGIGREELLPASITIATSWITAYTVRDFCSTNKKYYFVQDIESYFYARGSEYYFAEDTYRFGFHGITAGEWIASELHEKYGMQTTPIHFSYDRHLYQQHPKRDTKKRIFYYARPVTCRRGFELGLMVLAKVYQAMPDLEFVLAGWDVSEYVIPFPHLNAGVVALDELPDLYSQCDVGLVISFTNLSLLPIELMACGCVVVSNRGKNVEWVLNDSNSVLADATVESLTAAVVNVFQDDEYRNKLSKAGLEYSLATNWEGEADNVAALLASDL